MKRFLSIIVVCAVAVMCLASVSCDSESADSVARSFLAGYETTDGFSDRVLLNLKKDGTVDIYVGISDSSGYSFEYYTGEYTLGENEEYDETLTFTYIHGDGVSESVENAVIIDGIFEIPFFLNGAVTSGSVKFYETEPASTDGDVYVGYMTKTSGMGAMVYAYSICLKTDGKFDVSIMQLASVMHIKGRSGGTYSIDGENISFVYDVVDDEGEIVAEDYTSDGVGYDGNGFSAGFNIAQASVRASDAKFIKVK